jgi:hypothetical protein
MDKFDFGDAVKNDFGNGPVWSDAEKNDFGNGPSWADKLDFSKSDPVPDWPGDDPETAGGMLSIEGIEYGKSTGNEAIEGIEYGAGGPVIDPDPAPVTMSFAIDDGYF